MRKYGSRLLGAAGFAAVAVAAQPAAAADDAALMAAVDVPGLEVVGQRQRYMAEETATATRTNTPLQDVPQSVAVITSELIRDQSMQSMADLVRYVPGASMGQGEGHRDAPTLRGNASTADFFVDGVRDDVQYFRDLYNAERVEVLKGPNAMIFGRGGGGGVINRVLKKADWSMGREVTLELGSYDHRRATLDLATPFSGAVAGRIVGMFEDSESFRDFVGVERWGVTPTLSWRPSDTLTLQVGFEHFEDRRTVDRGGPSFQGRPSPAPVHTFFGDPDHSYAATDVDLVNATIEYRPRSGLTVRNRTLLGVYDKFYQNIFAAGPASASPSSGLPSTVPLEGYNNRTGRQNLFTQTDLILELGGGALKHTVLAGVELGRQQTDNFRNTAFFDNTATRRTVPFAMPTIRGAPVTFRQAASDADNQTEASVAALYVQDQIELGRAWQLIAGLRFDSFDIDFRNHRNGQTFARRDGLLSPRLGVVFKPAEAISLYGSFSVSFLPASGDQFSTLSATTAAFEPERFTNHELGAKWAIRPDLIFTAAAYQLDRDNTTAPDPTRPGVTVLTGSQRSRGFEAGLSGRVNDAWQVVGGYGWQEAEITSRTNAAPPGRRVPLTPEHTFSLWNRYQVSPMWGLGVGVIHQSSMFASIANTVTLPGFTRVDAAVYAQLTDKVRAQINIENLTDERYFPTSHGDNNILPGSPRALRVSLSATF